MLHVLLLTLALASGDCPDCDRANSVRFANPNRPGETDMPMAPALVPPRPVISHPSVVHAIPRPMVRCVGQNCFSCTRPFLPGVPVFNYRQEFDYPWSQVPCALPSLAAAGEGFDGPEVVPAPPMESRRRSPPKSKTTASRAGRQASDPAHAAVQRH